MRTTLVVLLLLLCVGGRADTPMKEEDDANEGVSSEGVRAKREPFRDQGEEDKGRKRIILIK